MRLGLAGRVLERGQRAGGRRAGGDRHGADLDRLRARRGRPSVLAGLEDRALPIPKARAKATMAATATRAIWRRWMMAPRGGDGRGGVHAQLTFAGTEFAVNGDWADVRVCEVIPHQKRRNRARLIPAIGDLGALAVSRWRAASAARAAAAASRRTRAGCRGAGPAPGRSAAGPGSDARGAVPPEAIRPAATMIVAASSRATTAIARRWSSITATLSERKRRFRGVLHVRRAQFATPARRRVRLSRPGSRRRRARARRPGAAAGPARRRPAPSCRRRCRAWRPPSRGA